MGHTRWRYNMRGQLEEFDSGTEVVVRNRGLLLRLLVFIWPGYQPVDNPLLHQL